MKYIRESKKKLIRDTVFEILDIGYYSPHAPPPDVTFPGPRCGDCFCTDQSVHTHANTGYLAKAERLITFIENL